MYTMQCCKNKRDRSPSRLGSIALQRLMYRNLLYLNDLLRRTWAQCQETLYWGNHAEKQALEWKTFMILALVRGRAFNTPPAGSAAMQGVAWLDPGCL